jgi:hypothetical protein
MVPWQVLWLLGGIVQAMHCSHLSSAAITFSFTGAQGTPMLPARPAYVPCVSLVDPLFLLTYLFICLSSCAVATHVLAPNHPQHLLPSQKYRQTHL